MIYKLLWRLCSIKTFMLCVLIGRFSLWATINDHRPGCVVFPTIIWFANPPTHLLNARISQSNDELPFAQESRVSLSPSLSQFSPSLPSILSSPPTNKSVVLCLRQLSVPWQCNAALRSKTDSAVIRPILSSIFEDVCRTTPHSLPLTAILYV